MQIGQNRKASNLLPTLAPVMGNWHASVSYMKDNREQDRTGLISVTMNVGTASSMTSSKCSVVVVYSMAHVTTMIPACMAVAVAARRSPCGCLGATSGSTTLLGSRKHGRSLVLAYVSRALYSRTTCPDCCASLKSRAIVGPGIASDFEATQ